MAPRRLEQIVAADDVGLQDGIPRPLDGESTEMDDAVDAGDSALDLGHAGEIGRDKGLVRTEIGRPLDVAQAQLAIDALEQLPQPRADAASRASDQNRLHDVPVETWSGIRGWRASRPAVDSACGC